MTFDPAIGKIVLFGGFGGSYAPYEAWVYDGADWSPQYLTPSPEVRSDASMAFDPAIGEVVLFGGYGIAHGFLADVWTYDGASWTPQYLDERPPVRSNASMDFDPVIGKMLLFGGYGNGGIHLGDTWLYDGARWEMPSPATSPSARSDASMVFDPAIGKMVLFGGFDGKSALNDTWTYDGTTWTLESTGISPPARWGASMAFDPAIGEIVLFGGGSSEEYLSDTWTYGAGGWVKQSPAARPAGRWGAAMAFSPAIGAMVLFGGRDRADSSDDTWFYRPIGPPIATINAPAADQAYVLDQTVPTNFSCFEAPGGPGLFNCLDSNNSASPGRLDTSTLGVHSYAVTATSADEQSATASIEYTVTKATPSIAIHAADNGLNLAQTTRGRAALGAGHDLTGKLIFRLFGPADPTCAAPPAFADLATISGNGDYQSAAFAPLVVGRYRWVISYAGDSNNEAISSMCDDEAGWVDVAKARPTIVSHTANATIGSPVYVSAAVEGRASPLSGATLDFRLYDASNSDCTGPPVFEDIGTAYPVAGGVVSSARYVPTVPGNYRWSVSYSGDPNNESIASNCAQAMSIAPICPDISVRGVFNGTAGNARKGLALGVRLRFRAKAPAMLRLRGRLVFSRPGKHHSVNLGRHRLYVRNHRDLVLPLPRRLRAILQQGRKAQLRLRVLAIPRRFWACPESQSSVHNVGVKVIFVPGSKLLRWLRRYK